MKEVGYSGLALYPSYTVTDNFGLGLRGEYFDYKGFWRTNQLLLTLSANLKSGV
jgi:hypothetical protein